MDCWVDQIARSSHDVDQGCVEIFAGKKLTTSNERTEVALCAC
ncbi:hypothetical protein OAH94_01650 [Amylibacter sp.]|nr:hypothetical protein [Amylibacter sp.]